MINAVSMQPYAVIRALKLLQSAWTKAEEYVSTGRIFVTHRVPDSVLVVFIFVGD